MVPLFGISILEKHGDMTRECVRNHLNKALHQKDQSYNYCIRADAILKLFHTQIVTFIATFGAKVWLSFCFKNYSSNIEMVLTNLMADSSRTKTWEG